MGARVALTLRNALEAQTRERLGSADSRGHSGSAESLGRSGSAEMDSASGDEGKLGGASGGKDEPDGTSGGKGELDGTSGGKGELDGPSGGNGELGGTSGGKGELDGTSGGNGELDRIPARDWRLPRHWVTVSSQFRLEESGSSTGRWYEIPSRNRVLRTPSSSEQTRARGTNAVANSNGSGFALASEINRARSSIGVGPLICRCRSDLLLRMDSRRQ